MAIGRAYPRRNDAVTFEEFDGTLESVQWIANITKTVVSAVIPPDQYFHHGDTMRLKSIEVGTTTVKAEDYVVVHPDGKVEIVDRWNFASAYSKDGN